MNAKTATRIERLRALAGDGNPNEHEREVARRALDRMVQRLSEAQRTAWAPNWQGEKYQATRGLGMTEITKLIRDEVKMLRRLGKLAQAGGGEGALKVIEPVGDAPAEIKISIRQPHYGSVNITLSNVPQEWGWRWGKDSHGNERWIATDALEAMGRELKALGEAYNYDDSDAMTDHFDRRYYLSVEACEPGRQYGTSIGYRRNY